MKKMIYLKTLTCFALMLLTSCAYFMEEADEESTPPLVKAETPTSSNSNSDNVKKAHQEVENKLEEMTIVTKAKPDSPSQLAPVSQAVTSFGRSVSPDIALGWLKNGNLRFTKNRLRKDGQTMADVRKNAESENPHTIIFTTSDSRVSPEIIFDQKIGEIFVVRTLSLALDQAAVASMEYAISQLGVRHILVLGHTYSPVIKSAVATSWTEHVGSENLSALYKDLKTQISNVKQPTNDPSLEREAWANTLGAADDLSKRSGLIALFLKEKKIKISTAIYKLDSGTVDFQ